MDNDSTATIEAAISHLPDDGGDVGEVDLAPGTDEGTTETVDAGEAAHAPELTTPGDDAAAAAAAATALTPPKEKKIPKWVPGHRFQAQTEAKQKAEALAAEVQAKLAALEADLPSLRERAQAADVFENHPEHTVEVLLKDPRYGKLLTRREAEAIVVAAASGTAAPPRSAGATAKAPPAPPSLGEPDIQLSDGSLTYSPERLAQYVQAVGEHARSSAEAKFETAVAALREELGGRIKPFEQQVVDRELNAKAEAARGQEWADLTEDYGKDFVTQHRQAVRDWLHDQWGHPDPKTWRPTTQVKNPKAGVREAERAVLKPAMRAKMEAQRNDALKAADQAKARAIAEQNTRAAAAGHPPSSAGVSRAAQSPSTEDIINAAIDRHGLAAA